MVGLAPLLARTQGAHSDRGDFVLGHSRFFPRDSGSCSLGAARYPAHSMRVAGALLASALFCATTVAQGPAPQTPSKPSAEAKPPLPQAPATPPPKPTPQLTAADLETFLDTLIPLQIEQADIAGAVVAVVKDGKPLFAKGYGYADYEKKIPVSAENTLFRPGSISKLFTWTAVMQQVEQGKLDLDRDVNAYLDFKIPPAFGKPITLRDIMTHRSGLEETNKDDLVASNKDLTSLAKYLPAHFPARIFPPGTIPAYSNYATALAGYIVQRVANQPFDDYVEAHILKPLNMDHATFRQPLPENLKGFMSNGYARASQGAKGFEWIQVTPAGALSASAESITHFMIAHLQNGRYGDVQILKPETAVQMHQRQPGWPAVMNAMALGFYEETRNGQRIIGHGGDTYWFHSDLHLLLDANVGFFVSYNSAGHHDFSLRAFLFDKFLDRYFPLPPPNEPTSPTAAQDARKVSGLYKTSRRSETNILSITTLLGESEVAVDPTDNTIYIDDFIHDPNGLPKHYREVGPLVFRSLNGPQKITFQNDAMGERIAFVDFPFMVFQPVNSVFDRKSFNFMVLGFSLGIIGLTLIVWPIAAILRKHYEKPLALIPQAQRLRLAVRIVCLIVVAGVIGEVLVLNAVDTPGALKDWQIHFLQVLGVLAGLGALVAIYNSSESWRDATQWRWTQIWNTVLAVACVLFFWFMFHWHLLNFHLNY
jgi:CubicO group peptidase (beta-lactamase class C family)